MNTTAISAAFPQAGHYAAMIGPRDWLLKEPRGDRPFPYSERHLQCVWFDSSHRPVALTASSGEAVNVEDPGCWNLEAGPDFLDAVLVIGPDERRVTGDVEIHVRPPDWKSHGHADDPRYDGVVAHITYFPGTVPANVLPGGAVQVSLKDAINTDPAFSFESIDVAAYPYAPFREDTPPCANILASWSPGDIGALLESAGEHRLKIKALRLAHTMGERGREQALYEEIMCALGYKHNRAAFRLLAQRVELEALRGDSDGDATNAYSILLGVAGLLPASVSPRWDDQTRVFVRQLWDNWWKQQSAWERVVMPRSSWRLSGTRPQNHPVRRLAAASVLFAPEQGFLSRFVELSEAPPDTLLEDAEHLFLETGKMEYWRFRLGLGGKRQPRQVALVGRERIASILANVLVPFLASGGMDVVPLLGVLPPEHHNSLARRMAFTLLGPDHNPALYRNGLSQQGLLQIFHDFCLNNRTNCKDCALCTALGN